SLGNGAPRHGRLYSGLHAWGEHWRECEWRLRPTAATRHEPSRPGSPTLSASLRGRGRREREGLRQSPILPVLAGGPCSRHSRVSSATRHPGNPCLALSAPETLLTSLDTAPVLAPFRSMIVADKP